MFILSLPLTLKKWHFVSPWQSTGGFIAVSRYASATPMPHSVLSRGVGWQVIEALLVLFALTS